MTPELVEKLCCPFDKKDLDLTVIAREVNGRIIEGYFICGECRRMYPIVKGIPIMNPDEYRDFKMERPLLSRWKESLKGKNIAFLPSLDE